MNVVVVVAVVVAEDAVVNGLTEVAVKVAEDAVNGLTEVAVVVTAVTDVVVEITVAVVVVVSNSHVKTMTDL